MTIGSFSSHSINMIQNGIIIITIIIIIIIMIIKVARNEDQTSASKGVASDIVEAEGFWRRLWEERGTGDENAE